MVCTVCGYDTRQFSQPTPELSAVGARFAHPARFEGYGPGAAALLVECVTEDRALAASRLRKVFADHGGALGAQGSVAYLFKAVAMLEFAAVSDVRSLTAAAFAAGAEDVVARGGGIVEVLADPAELAAVRERLETRGFAVARTEVAQRAGSAVRLAGAEARAMMRLLAALENLPEVENVYTNVEISHEVLARL